MNNKKFAIAFSEKEQEEAIKEASLKIKLIFPKNINNIIVLSSPHYNPANIFKTVSLALKPKKILGLQAPLLIFQEKVVKKGVIICCINKENVEIFGAFSKKKRPQDIETFLRSEFKQLRSENLNFMSFLSPIVNPFSYIKGVNTSLGKIFNLLGAGYLKQFSSYPTQMINNSFGEGLISVGLKGLKMHELRIGGYVPLGRSFCITKTTPNKDVIMEINNKPAVNIYKHFLEEKFKSFISNKLFPLYPFGITISKKLRLLNIIDSLDDGSLACLGKVSEGTRAHIMYLDSKLLLEKIVSRLSPLKNKGEGLAFLINSLTRKKILQNASIDEVKTIKESLGEEISMIGLYSDYSLFSDTIGDVYIETGDLSITLFE